GGRGARQPVPAVDEATLVALVRLPWFRHGSMPDWLRLRLIRSLHEDRIRQVRDLLYGLVLTTLNPDRGGFELEVARGARSALHSLGSRVYRLVARSAPPTSPLREHVFADFMAGFRPDYAAFRLPRAVADLLRLRRKWPVWALSTGLLVTGV